MTKPKAGKLLALAAPAALMLASPASAHPAARVEAAVVHRDIAASLASLTTFAAALRAIAAAAMTAPSAPMTAHDGCPLAGNVGKGARCDLPARAMTASATPAPAAPGSRR
jgi:hypothetical protein